MTNIPCNVHIMTSEPIKNLTPDDIRNWLAQHNSEKSLANAFAQVHNQTAWLAHDLDDEENPCPREIYGEWRALECELCERIINILDKENEACDTRHITHGIGTHLIIQPFMQRNGYRDGSGWWIYNKS